LTGKDPTIHLPELPSKNRPLRCRYLYADDERWIYADILHELIQWKEEDLAAREISDPGK
jgi:hypothetical protein